MDNPFVKRILFLCAMIFFASLGAFSQNAGSGTSTQEILDMKKVQQVLSSDFYEVTAGDIYTLSFAQGKTAVSWQLALDSSYRLKIPGMGTIECKGLSFLQLKEQVEKLVSLNYPLGGTQFLIANPAQFTVMVKGYVSQAQEKNAWALTRLSEVISGMLLPYSSERNIIIKRRNGKQIQCDLFKALRTGDLSQNPYMRPGDTIVIQRADRKVSLSGEVFRAGTYELLKGENLRALLTEYGITTNLSDTSRIKVNRIIGHEDAGEILYLTKNDFNSDFALMCDDIVTVPSLRELKTSIVFEGAVLPARDASGTGWGETFVECWPGDDWGEIVRANVKKFSQFADFEHSMILRKPDSDENDEGSSETDEVRIPLDIRVLLLERKSLSGLRAAEGDVLYVPFLEAQGR